MFSSQRSDLFSQDDYLTPATQQQHPPQPAAAGGLPGQGGGFLSHFAISSPSPIKKKSRSSRRGSGRAVALPAGGATIHEGNEDEPEGEGAGAELPAPSKGRKPPPAPPPAARASAIAVMADDGNSSMEPSSSTGSTACSSGSAGMVISGGRDNNDKGFADFRNLGSQGLTQSVVDGFGSLRMNGSSPDEEGSTTGGMMPQPPGHQRRGGPQPMQQLGQQHQQEQQEAVMQCSQDAAMGFRLKSVGADWNLVDQDAAIGSDGNPAPTSCGAGGGGAGAAEEEMIRVVSIPPCNVNLFAGSGGGAGSGEGSGEAGRKRHRQRKIKIPCRGGGGAGGEPAVISRYLMEFDQLETIGAGRFSLVYKVRKRLDGWVYAVKRSRHSLETEGEREAALREVFALAALQGCPHLVRYLGAWMEERHLYIQTEFCPGGSLERAVFPRGGGGGGGGGLMMPMPPPQQQQQQQQQQQAGLAGGFSGGEEALLRVARDVASALQFMHARGIVHMDVKPGNILLAGDGSFKLGDLGHAIKADGSMVVAEGDERYLSMEVLKGLDLFKLSAGTEVPNYQAILSPNDIFGLGASLYEVATRVPLASSGPEFRELREGRLRPLPHLSPGFQTLLRDMLAPAAPDRPTAADVVRRSQALLGAMVSSSTVPTAAASSNSNGSATTTVAAAAVAARAAAQHLHGSGAVGAPAGAVGAAGGHNGGAAPPHCQQAQQKRIKELEEIILSLTGLSG